jgi:hypothetical protein
MLDGKEHRCKGHEPTQHEATMCVFAVPVTNEDDLFLHLFFETPSRRVWGREMTGPNAGEVSQSSILVSIWKVEDHLIGRWEENGLRSGRIYCSLYAEVR